MKIIDTGSDPSLWKKVVTCENYSCRATLELSLEDLKASSRVENMGADWGGDRSFSCRSCWSFVCPCCGSNGYLPSDDFHKTATLIAKLKKVNS